jgi:hypothetical protein
MENILEIISKDNSRRLNEILCTQVTKRESSILDLAIKDVEELFVFACYSGSLSCLLVLSKFGKLNIKLIILEKENLRSYSAES